MLLDNNNSSQELATPKSSQETQVSQPPQTDLQRNLAEERSRRQREEKLFLELENAKKELDALKSVTSKISDNGWDVNTLINHSPKQESENPQILQMRRELERMNEKISLKEKELDKKTQLAEIKTLLNDHRDDFEFTLLHNAAPKVLQLMDHFYENEKKLLTPLEAARAIELELERYEEQKADILSKSKKAKGIYKGLYQQKSPNVPIENKDLVQTKPKLETPAEENSAPIKKPVAVVPPMLKKPKLRSDNVLNNGIKETQGSFRDPQRKNQDKSEILQRVLAQFST